MHSSSTTMEQASAHLCQELEVLAESSPLAFTVTDENATQAIARPKMYYADRSHLVSEKFGFDKVRLNSLAGFKNVVAQKKLVASSSLDGIDLLELNLTTFDVIKKIAVRSRDDLSQTPILKEIIVLKDHPWFSSLQGLDAKGESKENVEQTPANADKGASGDTNIDSDGWACPQCEEVNDEADDSCFLCAADRPSDDNDMSTLLLHAVCIQNELQSLLFFVLSMVYSIKNQGKSTLPKSSVTKALQVFENMTLPTPELLCAELEEYILKQRKQRISQAKVLLSVAGRLTVTDSSVFSTSGNAIVPGIVMATGCEIYSCNDIITNRNLVSESNAVSERSTKYFLVSITSGPAKVKVGWINPAYVFDEKRLAGLVVSAGEQIDVDVEKELSSGARIEEIRELECKFCAYDHCNMYDGSVDRANGIVEQGKMLSSVLLGKPIPKGNSLITSVTLKLCDSPGGVPCNKWAVVVCRRLKGSSKGFRLVSRAEIIVDEKKLMESQIVKLEQVLSVDKGDYVGVSNPYGTLGLCCVGNDVSSRETFFASSGLSWGFEGSSMDLNTFAYSDPKIGKSCIGLSFHVEPEPLSRNACILGKNYQALADAKSLHVLDVEKYISKNYPREELENETVWYENKENRIACYVTPCDNYKENMVGIGYIVNNHDLGIVFEGVDISQGDGIAPAIVFDMEDSASMAEDETLPNTTDEVQESVHDQANSTSQPVSSSSVVTDIENTESSEASATTTSDGGNSNGGAKQSAPFAAGIGAKKLTIRDQNVRQTKINVKLSVNRFLDLGTEIKKKVSVQKNDAKVKKAETYSGSFVNFSQNAYLSSCVTCGDNIGFAGDCTIELLFRPSRSYLSILTNALDESSESFRIFEKLDGDQTDETNEMVAKLTFDTILYWAIPLVGLCVSIAPDGRLFCFMKNSNTYCYTRKYRIKSYAWRHLSISIQSCRPTIFIDGVQINVSEVKPMNDTFDYIWACVDAKVNHEANIHCGNFFAGSVSQAISKGRKSLDHSGWEGDISDIRVWKVARNSKDISRYIGRNLFKSFPMYYDEAYQSKGLIGYFPFVEKCNCRIHDYCHSLASGPTGCVSGGNFVWKTESYTTESVPTLTSSNTVTSSLEKKKHELEKAGCGDASGMSQISYSRTVEILLSWIGNCAEDFYKAHFARFQGHGLGNLYNIVPPSLVVQTTNLTFYIVTKMLQLFTSSPPVESLQNIDTSKVVISLLKILLGNIYHLRWSKQSVEAFSDGILRSILENLARNENKEISKYAVLNMSMGISVFFCGVAEIKSIILKWSDSLLSCNADQSLVTLFVNVCGSIVEQEILVTSLAMEVKADNSKSLIQNLLLVLCKCGSVLSLEQKWVLVKLVRTIQDYLTAQGGDALQSTLNIKDRVAPISNIDIRSYKSIFKAELTSRDVHEAQKVIFDPDRISHFMKISEDGTSVTPTRKSWGACCVRTKGFAYRSGVYKFVVHIDKLSRDGYAFIGILFNGGDLNRFVGADIQGYGRGFLLCQGTTWHKGNQSAERIRSFGTGSTLEFIVDTFDGYGTVQLRDIESGENYGVIMDDIFRGIERGTCFPAVSPYDVGDKISILSCGKTKQSNSRQRYYTQHSQKQVNAKTILADADTALIRYMSFLMGQILQCSFEDDHMSLILTYLHHPLVVNCSSNFKFHLIDSFEIIEKCFRVLEKMIDAATVMKTDKLTLSKTDIIFDNMLSLAAFVSKVMAKYIMHVPSGSKLKQPSISKIFDEPIFLAIDFLRTKNSQNDLCVRDIHEPNQVCETFRECLLGVNTNTNAIDSLNKFALDSLNYKPAFVITKGSKKHEEMVFAIAIGILHYCRWTFFDTKTQNASNFDFHAILRTMGPTCKEQLIVAYKTALDIKALALRRDNENFMDRVLATTKLLLGMQLLNDATKRSECNDGNATLLANSFKNIILKNSTLLDLADALRLAVTDVTEIIRLRKKGVTNFARMFSLINSINDEESQSNQNLKILLSAIACNELPKAPWHCDIDLESCSSLLKSNLSSEMTILVTNLFGVYSTILHSSGKTISGHFVSDDKITPIISRACAICFGDLEYSILQKSNLLNTMNNRITCRGINSANHDIVKLFYYFCVCIKQTQNTNESTSLLITLLWKQLQFIAKNYNNEPFCSSLEDTLLQVLILFTEDKSFLPTFREHHTRWVLNLVAFIKSTAQENSCSSLISIIFNIMKIAESDDASMNELQQYNSTGWTALIIILIEVCFVQFSEHQSIRQHFSVSLQELIASNCKISSRICRILVDLVLEGNVDEGSTKPKHIKQFIINILNSGHKHFSSWRISDEDCFAMINNLLIEVEKRHKNSNINEEVKEANLKWFVGGDNAIDDSQESKYNSDYIGDILNFFYLSIVEAKGRKIFELFEAKARFIFDIAFCDRDVNETEVKIASLFHYSCIAGLEKMLTYNGLHRPPGRNKNTTSTSRERLQNLEAKPKETDPLFHEIDSQEYESRLRYKSSTLKTWDDPLLDKDINVPLILRKLYAQRLFGFTILHDCALVDIRPEEIMKILYSLMLYDYENKNLLYIEKILGKPSVFPQHVLNLITKVIETLAMSQDSIYSESLVMKNLKSYPKKLQNIRLMKRLTSEIISIGTLNASGNTYEFYLSLVQGWSKGLHCSSMKIKENVFVALTGIFESVLSIDDTDMRSSVQAACVAEIPILLLEKLAVSRLDNEMEYYPLISKFCQNLMGLLAILRVCSNKYSMNDHKMLNGASEKYLSCAKIPSDETSEGFLNSTGKGSSKTTEGENSLFKFDKKLCHPSITLSEDLLSVEATSNEHMIVLGDRGFKHGIHYWSVKLNHMEWGKTYIGVTEKPVSLNGWPTKCGYGLVTYRATHARGQETMYGTVLRTGDTVGILLDMDCGTISFVKEGEDAFTGNKIFQNMGIAYRNIRTRDRKADSNVTLYPCIGFGRASSKVSLKDCRYLSCPTPSVKQRLDSFGESIFVFRNWCKYREHKIELPFLKAIFELWKKWKLCKYSRCLTPNKKNVLEVVENAFNEGISGEIFLNVGTHPAMVDDVDALTISQEVKMISFEKFQQLSTTYDLHDDRKMVEFLNKFCDQNGVNPFNLEVLPFQDNMAREIQFCLYLYFNSHIENFLPFVCLSPSEDVVGPGNNADIIKSLIFKCMKINFWNDALAETATATRPPEDEWDKPSEIPEIVLNRVGASPQILSKIAEMPTRFTKSLFGQMRSACNSWSASHWRRSYQHVTDKGQSRAFFAKFLGENVDDNGGPYRAVFVAAACDEPCNVLELIDQHGRFKYSSSLDNVRFFGKLVGLAVRHQMLLPLPFSFDIWEYLVGNAFTGKKKDGTLGEVSGMEIYNSLKYMDENDAEDLLTEIMGVDKFNEHIAKSINEMQNTENCRIKYQDAFKRYILKQQWNLLESFRDGLSLSLPKDLFPMFTAKELKCLICGEDLVNLELLKNVTVYDQGVDPTDKYIVNFWEVLHDMTEEEKGKFINFVYARKRLPASASGFIMPFKILCPLPYMKEKPDNFLPHAKTCFFELAIPKYSSAQVCRQKLLYAIENCTTMEDYSSGSTDFVI